MPSLELASSPDELRIAFAALRTPRDIAALLDVRYAQLIYHIHKVPAAERYALFEIPKRAGGVRRISAPRRALKILQRKLNQMFQAVYVPRSCTHGFVNQRSIVTNAGPHVGKRLVLNVDLADFFPSINFGRVRGMLRARPYNLPEKVATMLAQICCHNNELPQGAPTSPVVANMVCARLDGELTRLARSCRCAYSRYADDLSFSTTLSRFPEQLVASDNAEVPSGIRLGESLRRTIRENGFAINTRKVRLLDRRHRQEVTGLVVNQRVNVRRSFVRRIRAMLHAWDEFDLDAAEREFLTKYDRRHRQPEQAPSFKSVVKGMIDYVGMVRGNRDRVYRRFLVMYAQLDPGFVLPREMGWDKVNRQMEEAKARLRDATTEEQCQSIGHLCREAMISLAQTVFDLERHGSAARPDVGTADAKEMLCAVIEIDLKGGATKEVRGMCRKTVDLANSLTHNRTATRREAEVCFSATKAMVDQIGAACPAAVHTP
jgi:RNA-directed DNA polymerase